MERTVTDGQFFNPSKGELSFTGVVREIVAWMQEAPNERYDIIVGCDSPSSPQPSFPIAVVVLREKQGGRFFLRRINYGDQTFHTWRDRILREVMLSCDLAISLKQQLAASAALSDTRLRYEFRYIHADVGATGATKDMIKEVTGVIHGNGFEPKIKPESYVASSVADRYT